MYRNLNDSEIKILKQQGCSAENWVDVLVTAKFSSENIFNTQFAGAVKLGFLRDKIEVEKSINKPAGIKNSYIENCTIGDNVLICNVNSLVNYTVANNVVIENVGTVVVNGETAFGNGTEIEVLNEGGGRELPIFDKLSAQVAYMLVVYRHDKKLTEKITNIIARYIESKKSTTGNIGENARITNTISLRNVNVGAHTVISGASNLEEGTIVSCKEAPVKIGEDVIAKKFIVLSGSTIDSGAILTSTFVGQGVKMGKQFSSEGSAFFANCEGFHGEACSLFAGPYTVTHHKSTLLIAGMFSFFNAGSGTNQSNHMYKLGPLHQGIVERGSKTGSFSYLLWPCRIGAFSVVMDKHGGNFDTSDLPFSYITVENGKSVITPAMNLFTVGTKRDSEKWPTRDRREGPGKLDLINFEFLNPYIMGRVLKGSEVLKTLSENTPRTREFVNYKGINILRLMLRTTRKYYELLINIYVGGEVLKRIGEITAFSSFNDVIERLKPVGENGKGNWVDILGMFMSEDSFNNFRADIINGEIFSIDGIQSSLTEIFGQYNDLAWNWCASIIELKNECKITDLTKDHVIQLISEYQKNAVKLNNMILKDAEKEFDSITKIGFGVDGDEQVRDQDFENVRGTYEKNKFVSELIRETEKINYDTKRITSIILEL
ncbi:MAG: DUF4954 family protein [Bacteroidetes bacterium]|nr:DUF4954 family protein [Bacteroidota bacterium]